MDTLSNVSTRRSPYRVGDVGCGRCVNVSVLWCGIVLLVEVDIVQEERGGVLGNDIAAIADCRGLVDGE